MQKPVDPTLKEAMRQQMQAAGSMKAYAQQLQVDFAHLRKVYEGIIPPGSRLLKRIGLKRVTKTFYVKACVLLPEKAEHPDTTKARLYDHLCNLLGVSNHEEAMRAINTLKTLSGENES